MQIPLTLPPRGMFTCFLSSWYFVCSVNYPVSQGKEEVADCCLTDERVLQEEASPEVTQLLTGWSGRTL